MASGMGSSEQILDPFLSEIGPLMALKCDVCVLSEYNQVFRLIDGILESELWPTEEQEEEEEKTDSDNENEILEQDSDWILPIKKQCQNHDAQKPN